MYRITSPIGRLMKLQLLRAALITSTFFSFQLACAAEPVVKERAVLDKALNQPVCPSDDYDLSKDKKWCVKRCPEYKRYSSERRKCVECEGNNMIDKYGICHPGV